MIQDKERCAALRAEYGSILLDYSRQRVTNETMDMLFNLAEVSVGGRACLHALSNRQHAKDLGII